MRMLGRHSWARTEEGRQERQTKTKREGRREDGRRGRTRWRRRGKDIENLGGEKWITRTCGGLASVSRRPSYQVLGQHASLPIDHFSRPPRGLKNDAVFRRAPPQFGVLRAHLHERAYVMYCPQVFSQLLRLCFICSASAAAQAARGVSRRLRKPLSRLYF